MIYDLTVKQFSKTLLNLSAILDKGVSFAEHKNIPFEVLLNSRLAPDQFELLKQIQIACDSAKLGVARLADKVQSAPKHDDKETNVQQLKQRIKEVIDYLSGFSPDDFANVTDTNVSLSYWKGKSMNGYEFAIQYLIPNFYFHVTTAYSILRHNGVDVGKLDFLGELPFRSE